MKELPTDFKKYKRLNDLDINLHQLMKNIIQRNEDICKQEYEKYKIKCLWKKSRIQLSEKIKQRGKNIDLLSKWNILLV